jgi:transcriptional regulator with XRE-family HTH domain
MPATTAPPARRQVVGGTLRRFREGFGATLADAAEVLGCSPSKISRIEAGERGVHPDELRLLLAEYGIDDQDVRDALAALVTPHAASGWRPADEEPGTTAREYLELEALATRPCYYAPLRVPGVLQTPGYAESQNGATTGAPSLAVEEILSRQATLLDGTRTVHVVVSEAALLQAAGRPPVMRQQMAHLAILTESAQVVLQVVPFSALSHPAPDLGAMTVLRFGQPCAGIAIVHLPGAGTGQLLAGDDASAYVRAWEQLSGCALTPQESLALLRQLTAA